MASSVSIMLSVYVMRLQGSHFQDWGAPPPISKTGVPPPLIIYIYIIYVCVLNCLGSPSSSSLCILLLLFPLPLLITTLRTHRSYPHWE